MFAQGRKRIIGLVYVVIIILFVSFSLALLSTDAVRGQSGTLPTPTPGLVGLDTEAMNAGFIKASSGPCAGMYEIEGLGLCTLGFHLTTDHLNTAPVPPLEAQELTAQSGEIQCDGDGVSGNRIQVLYVHPPQTNRFNQYLASFQQWMADMDTIFNASAAETGGARRVRFVHDAGCKAVVLDVQVSAGAMTVNNPFQMWNELNTLGYNRTDRKYVVFAETNAYSLGIGTTTSDDSLSPNNAANKGPSYTSTPINLWGGSNPAHELMHTLGAVQSSAPHSTGFGHCTDEYDRMCYVDNGGKPLTFPCGASSHEQRFDCGHDDYYHTNPAGGSYLATHWNTANSSFLLGATPFRKTWTGTTNTSWTTSTNWNSSYGANAVPVKGDDCYIPAGAPRYPIITGVQPECGTLTVEAGAQVIIQDGFTAGTAAISGTVEVRNNSFFDATSGVTVKPGGRLLLQNGGAGMYFYTANGTLTVEGTVDITGTFPIYAGDFNPDTVEATSAHVVIQPTGLVNIVPGGVLKVDGSISNNGTFKETKYVAQNTTTSFLTVGNKYYGLDITLAAGGDMGSTVVEVKGNQICPEASILTDTIRRCYTITPAVLRTATVKFYYRSSEGIFHSVPFAYHFNGTTWDQLASSRGGSGEAKFVQATGVNAYSPFALLDPNVVIRRVYMPTIIKN